MQFESLVPIVRIEIRHRNTMFGRSRAAQRSSDAREEFWTPFRHAEARSSAQVLIDDTSMESRIIQMFGPMLQAHIAKRMRGVTDRYTTLPEGATIVRRFDQTLPKSREMLAALESTLFVTRIAGYGSLDLDLFVGPLAPLVKAFAPDQDLFLYLLQTYAPDAFAAALDPQGSTYWSVTDQHSFAVYPSKHMVEEVEKISLDRPPAATPIKSVLASNSLTPADRFRVLANGTLVIPVALALAVLFFASTKLSDLAEQQREAIAPLLQHHLELLREDRSRMTQKADGQAAHQQSGADEFEQDAKAQ